MIFNVLLKRESDLFVAHYLELDIVATAPTAQEAESDVIDLICAQVGYAFAHENLEHLYHPAPAEAWREFFE
ncbi:MAG: hypothetical protein AB1641_08935 [Thermodesulfobacteriota bacterium]